MILHYAKRENGFLDMAFSQHEMHMTIKMPYAYFEYWLKDYPLFVGSLEDQARYFIEHNFNLNTILS